MRNNLILSPLKAAARTPYVRVKPVGRTKAVSDAWAVARAVRGQHGQLNGLSAYLGRATLPVDHPGALSPERTLAGLLAGLAPNRRAMQAAEHGLRNDPSRFVAALLARDPSFGASRLQLLRNTGAIDQGEHAALLQALHAPLPLAPRLQLLSKTLQTKVAIALLQAHLSQLQAVNQILLDWGEHLRKLAKRDKLAHEKAHAKARELAAHNMADLQRHLALLGVGKARNAAAAAAQAQQREVRGQIDRLVQRLVADDAPLRSWPNRSLHAALTLPVAGGVQLHGAPRPLPGRRLFGQAI